MARLKAESMVVEAASGIIAQIGQRIRLGWRERGDGAEFSNFC